MAKPKQKQKRKPSSRAPATPAVTQPEPAPLAEVTPAPPAARASRRELVIAAVVVSACAAATALLLSGWTPGPGLPTPPRSAARAPAAPKTPAKPRSVPKKSVPKRVTTPRTKPLSAAAELFAGECGFCHTLAAAGTTGRVGPNLDQLRPSRQRVLDAIAAGGRRTGLMPPGLVSGAEAQQVARYVARVTHR